VRCCNFLQANIISYCPTHVYCVNESAKRPVIVRCAVCAIRARQINWANQQDDPSDEAKFTRESRMFPCEGERKVSLCYVNSHFFFQLYSHICPLTLLACISRKHRILYIRVRAPHNDILYSFYILYVYIYNVSSLFSSFINNQLRKYQFV